LTAGELGVEPNTELQQRSDAPAVGCVIPARSLNNVVFPAPFTPMTQTASAGSTLNETSLRTHLSSERRVNGSKNSLTRARCDEYTL
jgi:hypothetical protein